MRINQYLEHERPRERLLEQGVSSLSDAELVAVLLGNGAKGQNAVELGARLLSIYGTAEIKTTTAQELCAVHGIGSAKAARILAAMELSRRIEHAKRPMKLLSYDDAAQYCQSIIGHLEQEHFLVVCLDARHNIRGHDIVTKGLINASIVHPREVFRNAVRMNAHTVIVAHNHPSGDMTASEEDIATTKALREAGQLLGIALLDHIIVAQDVACSIMSSCVIANTPRGRAASGSESRRATPCRSPRRHAPER